MTIDASTVLFAASCYLLLFFCMALITERGLVPMRLLQHPGFYVLSLGIVVSSWSFYSVYLTASTRGLGFNAYYIGIAGAFIFSPLLLKPMLRITHRFQLASLADLFAFRFRSAWSGTLTTLLLLICAFPLMALQTLAIAHSTAVLAPSIDEHWVALAFNLVILGFALKFGITDVSGREPNNSLVASLAFEGLFKLLVLLLTGCFAIYGVFNGSDSMQAWLATQPPAINRLQIEFLNNSTNMLSLLFFTAAIALPHIFHMIFPENRNPLNLRTASWGVPLYVLLASLPVMPVLWAYNFLGQHENLQFAPLMIAIITKSPVMSLLYFLGGLAAATGLTVVLVLSVANMCMNHILLRTSKPPADRELYSWLMLRRRSIICCILLLNFLYYMVIADRPLIQDTGLVSFIACLQFLPGLLLLLYWPPANCKGFISGLAGGSLVWLFMGLYPYLQQLFSNQQTETLISTSWNVVIATSLLANFVLVFLVSAFTNTTAEERKAALLCAPDASTTNLHVLRARSVVDFISSLCDPMGADAAGREVAQALRDLHLQSDEKRPFQLLQLRTHLEANLSSLLGPTLAHEFIEQYLPFVPASHSTAGVLNLLEAEAESWQGGLTGIALDLDLLRRHHRQILQNLPMGVCELDDKGRVVMWNAVMSKLTGLPADRISGQTLSVLPQPWQRLLQDFAQDRDSTRLSRHAVQHEGKTRWFSLQKSVLAPAASSTKAGKSPSSSGQIILLEDQSETVLMEKELAHSDRLNSIGRLAAGVAHEIGNPVTGIACIAQNLRDEQSDADVKESASRIIAQTRRIATITDALLRFSHSGSIQAKPANLEPVELHKVTQEALSLFTLQQDGPEINLINTCEAGLCINANYQQLLQILLNLLGNARDASKPGDTITISSHQHLTQAALSVEDEGSGIPASLLPRVFEPFFTTKDPGKGTGLGLALVYRLVTDLGGTIRIDSNTGADLEVVGRMGTRVIVTFPCYDPATLVTKNAEIS